MSYRCAGLCVHGALHGTDQCFRTDEPAEHRHDHDRRRGLGRSRLLWRRRRCAVRRHPTWIVSLRKACAFVNYYGEASCTAGRASFITGRIAIRSSLSSVLAPGDPNGITKSTPTIAQYLKKAGYTTVQLGKWHLGDRPENFPTANGFDEMYYMLPYYAGVYAYDYLPLHPNFPINDAGVHG